MSRQLPGRRADRSRSPDQLALERAWGREAARLLALLREKRISGLTVEAMRAQGIDAPAQAIYTLQLAGYTIDRVSGATNGQGTTAYRLRGSRAALSGRSPLPGADTSHDA